MNSNSLLILIPAITLIFQDIYWLAVRHIELKQIKEKEIFLYLLDFNGFCAF